MKLVTCNCNWIGFVKSLKQKCPKCKKRTLLDGSENISKVNLTNYLEDHKEELTLKQLQIILKEIKKQTIQNKILAGQILESHLINLGYVLMKKRKKVKKPKDVLKEPPYELWETLKEIIVEASKKRVFGLVKDYCKEEK